MNFFKYSALFFYFFSISVFAEQFSVGRIFDKWREKPVYYQPTFANENFLKTKNYIIGIHPLHNPKRLFEIYAPIVDLFNLKIPNASFTLEASRDYADFDKKLYNQHFDFAMPNPYQTVNALKHNYRVFAKMGDDQDFVGIILIRSDSTIKEISDLKGKAISYPAPTALAATLMPQYYLHTHGVNINTEVENKYVGSQESSILNVLKGDVAAGATWPVPWRNFVKEQPKLANQLVIKWQTQPLVNNSWVVNKRVSNEITQQVQQILVTLENSPQGKNILIRVPITRFEAANDETYKPVEQFIQQFNKTVRTLETPKN